MVLKERAWECVECGNEMWEESELATCEHCCGPLCPEHAFVMNPGELFNEFACESCREKQEAKKAAERRAA